MPEKDLSLYCVSPKASVREVMGVIDRNKEGIVLVTDDSGLLIGTVTDGDIRRFMLANRSFDEPCTNVMWINPTTASVGASREDLHTVMIRHRLRSIPLTDESGQLKGLVHLRDLIPMQEKTEQVAVLMAGGEGRRLRPLTDNIPKPMVRVGDKPILETIISGLAQCSITKLYLAVNYQAHMIEDYFGDGSKYGVQITYLKEKEKKGTAGALSLLPEIPSEPLIVMNGDVVTTVNFTRMLDFHRQHRSVMTIAASEYHINIPYGVLNLAGHYVLGVTEKPSQQVHCSAGIYVINPELLRFVPSDRPYNMTELMHETTREGLPITAFPIREYWVDIGQKDDLQKARTDFGQISEHFPKENG